LKGIGSSSLFLILLLTTGYLCLMAQLDVLSSFLTLRLTAAA
jgi:hypothetical protein